MLAGRPQPLINNSTQENSTTRAKTALEKVEYQGVTSANINSVSGFSNNSNSNKYQQHQQDQKISAKHHQSQKQQDQQ